MTALQPVCCWRPVAPQRSPVMAGTIGVPVAVSFTSIGLEIRKCGAKLLSECSERRDWAGWRNDSRGSRERGLVVMARRGGGGTSRGAPKQDELSRNSSTISKKNSHKEPNQEDDELEDYEFDEDALEALFAQLEMDLEGGGISDDEDLTDEEVAELENELAVALRDIEEEEAEELRTMDVVAGEGETGPGFNDPSGDSKSVMRNKGKSDVQNTRIKMKDEFADAIMEEYADEEDEQRVITLEPWQLRKLAAAVEIGRRKVNIKALSAEVCMDRFDVLAWLKNPPPELLMYCATMESEESAGELPLETSAPNNSPQNLNHAGKQDLGPNPEGVPNWKSQRRLRKEHEATFERVFSNTDRPSNAILQNLVELTHVPRKRIVEWFEQRRKSIRVSPKFEALR